MEIRIKIGTKGNQTKIVEKRDTAVEIGSGAALVLATPSLIALMEKTAFESIESNLPKGFSSVGTGINMQHIKASLPGSIITCESEVTHFDGKKVEFEISSYDEKGLIGKCEHTRYIVNSEKFIARLKE